MAIWPAGLPQTQFIGLSDQRVSAVIRTATDAGVAKVRRRFTSTPRNVPLPIVITNAQRITFDTFFISTLKEGSLPFDWTDPVDDATVSFRFLAPPSFVRLSNRWETTMSLEILP